MGWPIHTLGRTTRTVGWPTRTMGRPTYTLGWPAPALLPTLRLAASLRLLPGLGWAG